MLIVQKYGGTSVGTLERIKEVAKRVARTKNIVKNPINTDRIIQNDKAEEKNV